MMMISNVFVRFLIGSQVGFSQGAKSNSNHGVCVLPSYIRCAGRPGLERCVQGDLGWWRRSSLAGPGSAMRATLPLWGTCTSHSGHWQLGTWRRAGAVGATWWKRPHASPVSHSWHMVPATGRRRQQQRDEIASLSWQPDWIISIL